MSLSPASIQRIEKSFEAIKPSADQLADTFYQTLFATAPSVKAMFPKDLSAQKKKLMGAVALAVSSLRSLDKLVPALEEMGARHVTYGARDEMYPIVEDAMLKSMAKVGGAAWSPEVAKDWKAALELISATMIEGAHKSLQNAAA